MFVWYTGRLAHNKKVFDSHVAGPDCSKPYMFRLGVGEVIPGWDNGITGELGVWPGGLAIYTFDDVFLQE